MRTQCATGLSHASGGGGGRARVRDGTSSRPLGQATSEQHDTETEDDGADEWPKAADVAKEDLSLASLSSSNKAHRQSAEGGAWTTPLK